MTAVAPLTIENIAPVARAGADQSIYAGQLVTLNGSGSSDTNGDSLSYGWTQTGGRLVQLNDTTARLDLYRANQRHGADLYIDGDRQSLGMAASTPDQVVVIEP